MGSPGAGSVLERIAHLWWVRLPLAARRASAGLALALLDGVYLATARWAGALVPPLALAAGLWAGAAHPGFDVVFSESTAVLLLAVALGVAGAGPGTLFLAGFALGDFFLSGTGWAPVPVRIPMLIEYGVLALLVVQVPIATKGLLARLPLVHRLSPHGAVYAAMAAHALLSAALVFFWARAAPILLRPAFTWPGGSPSVAAMSILQQRTWLLSAVAAAVSLARVRWQGATVLRPALAARMDALEAELGAAAPVEPLTARIAPVPRVAMRAAAVTLLLAGMIGGPVDLLLLGGTAAAVEALRSFVSLGAWARLMERVPPLLRLAAGLAVVYALAAAVLRTALYGSSFRPIAVLTAAALVVFYLLAPGSPGPRPKEAAP